MNKNPRPVPVVLIAGLYLAVGLLGFAYHFRELLAWQHDSIWVEATEGLAILCGAYLLRGHNWARWLALAWMGFHVVLSAFHSFQQTAIHALFFIVIAWCLFHPAAGRYFRKPEMETP